jgi:hypothetical protein
MLDVHPPHHAAHGWRDFFIHIATIVVGLLIAVGLEQIVEHIHERYQLSETRESLQHEREANRKDLIQDSADWRWEMAELENNLVVLRYVQQHPGTAQSELPGVLQWIQAPKLAESSAWNAAEKNGLTRLMSLDEANGFNVRYRFLEMMGVQSLATWDAFNDAGRYSVADGDPTHLSPDELQQTIGRLQFAMEKHIQLGYTLALLNRRFPDLGSTLTYKEVMGHVHQPDKENATAMAAALARTQARLPPDTSP